MNKKIILVTGSNKGIGLEIVRQLAKLHHQVILTSRDETKGLSAIASIKKEDLEAHFVQLDITDTASVEQCFEKVKKDFGKVDVLINNAAILFKEDQSLTKNKNEITELTINTNAIAQLNLTRKFLSLIPRGGRIIMVSSEGGSMSDEVGGWSPAYCISKTLLNAMTRHLASELRSNDIAVNAMSPGWVRTDMGGRSAPRSVEQGADTAVWLATAERIPTGKFIQDRKEIPW